jgi:plastocyanin
MHRSTSCFVNLAILVGVFVVLTAPEAARAGAPVPPMGCGFGHDTCSTHVLTALNLQYVSGPESLVEFHEVKVEMSYGDKLEFFNADAPGGPAAHEVTELNPFGAPRFATEVVAVGAHANVAGVEALTPGHYQFFCRLHPTMKGEIHVIGGGFGIG